MVLEREAKCFKTERKIHIVQRALVGTVTAPNEPKLEWYFIRKAH